MNKKNVKPALIPPHGGYRNLLIKNEDIKEITAEIPEGRTSTRGQQYCFQDGTELVFQKAAIANLVRTYINVKTHPAAKKDYT